MNESKPPFKITLDCQPVFPCWLWSRYTNFWHHFPRTPSSVLERGYWDEYYTYWHPDQHTAPTCTPSEGEKPPHRTFTVCWSNPGGANQLEVEARGVHEAALLAEVRGVCPEHIDVIQVKLLQPDHSAQEAAERGQCPRCGGTKYCEIDCPPPTQSQQPPVSPGSGKALQEAIAKTIIRHESNYDASIHHSTELECALVAAITPFLAQPTLSTGEALRLLRDADELHLGRCASSEPFKAEDYRNHACAARLLVKSAKAALSAQSPKQS